MMGKLSGRVALVTGSGRGIGRSIALACAREGARVGLTARTLKQLDGVAGEITAAGGEAFVLTADVMDGAAIKAMVAGMIDHFGRLDILFNNAGGSLGSAAQLMPATHDDSLFENILFLNLTSAYYATRAALPQMIKQDYGRIIFTGSEAGRRGGGFIAYSAAKAGMMGMTRALAHQVPPTITVNTLVPGWINTDILDYARLARNWGVDEAAARARVEGVNVQKRVLEPDELCPMAILLASDDGKGITGQELCVDGGFKV